MKKAYVLVKEAYRSLRERRYAEAIVILERVLSLGFGDIYILFLLAVSYLYTDQFGKANRFIRKMTEMDGSYPPLLQLKAYLQLKSAPGQADALKIYLDLLDQYPADPHLNRAKSLISGTGDFVSFQRDARLHDFVELPRPGSKLKKIYGAMEPDNGSEPPPQRPRRRRVGKLIPLALTAGIIAAGIPAAIYLYNKGLFTGGSEKPHEVIDRVAISGRDYDLIRTVNRDRVPFFYHSTDTLMKDFESAKRLIKGGEYNQALLLLNRIHNSNANFIVKERTDFLIRFVTDAGGRVYEKVPFGTVMESPHLYRGFGLELEGRVANLQEKPESATFTLLVNYLDEKKISGVAEVFSKGPAGGFSDGDTVRVRALFMSILKKSGRPYLVAKHIAKMKPSDGGK